MKVELFPFQKLAESRLRMTSAVALGSYRNLHVPQVVSFTAPTGAGKTIILAALIEDIYYGDDQYPEQPEAIFIWISDSPELNEQSRMKIDFKADKIRLDQCVTITDESFDREVLEDGHIYFLNTQKLGKSSNLTKHSDSRQYTIWETLQNTVRDKSDRLYVVIDEAHRGMQGREAGRATTIMQKFIKGSSDDKLDPMPVVIGMSATTERFNNLVGDTPSTIQKVVVTADDVRASGLLKDRIVITYPEDSAVNKDMAVLQTAADNWKDKWDHWSQYCQEQHYAYVNPVFVVQVQNGTGTQISETDLDECIQKIEERTGFRFSDGEIVHTFGQTTSTLSIHGVNVRYEEPSRIADDRTIKVVFFKENLSTGWDCPRAETMMSFRRANDATYIAQLLGRMVRTPMQMHIQVDDSLNDVHLFLPYFNRENVQKVVDALQSAEGGNIPTDIQGETLSSPQTDILTVRPPKKKTPSVMPGQMLWTGNDGEIITHGAPVQLDDSPKAGFSYSNIQPPQPSFVAEGSDPSAIYNHGTNAPASATKDQHEDTAVSAADSSEAKGTDAPVIEHIMPYNEDIVDIQKPEEDFDREAVMKAINDTGLLTFNVRNVQITRYLPSMYKMARLLTQSGLYPAAIKDVVSDVVQMIRDYVDDLIHDGLYDDLVDQARQFKLTAQIYDVFGESVDNYYQHDLFSSTDTDIERQFRLAETKLGGQGIGNEYGRLYYDEADPNAFRIDVILFAADNDCIGRLNTYAENKFHQLNDDYRRYMITVEERYRTQYDSIVSDGDIISKHNFRR